MEERMIRYLQSMMDDFKKEEARYGMEDPVWSVSVDEFRKLMKEA